MPYTNNIFYVIDRNNLYDDRHEDLLQDTKEIIARINVPSPNKEDITNRICNIELLIYGDYDCEGKKTGVPCILATCNGFCWQHAGEVCR